MSRIYLLVYVIKLRKQLPTTTNKNKVIFILLLHYLHYSYVFNDFPMTDSDTCKATVRMFLDLNLVSKFHIPYPVSKKHNMK